MYNVVIVVGMISHVIHSTKDRVSAVISTCNKVNKNFSLKQSSFLIMYLTLTYYILLDGGTGGYDFFGIPRSDVIDNKSRFNNMCDEEVEEARRSKKPVMIFKVDF